MHDTTTVIHVATASDAGYHSPVSLYNLFLHTEQLKKLSIDNIDAFELKGISLVLILKTEDSTKAWNSVFP